MLTLTISSSPARVLISISTNCALFFNASTNMASSLIHSSARSECRFCYYSTRVPRSISRIGSILIWRPHWICYVINAYIFHLKVPFAYINTYQVFLSVAKAIAMVNTSCSIARVRNRSRSKTQNCFFFLYFLLSFFPSCQKFYYRINQLYHKLVGRRSNENTLLTTV